MDSTQQDPGARSMSLEAPLAWASASSSHAPCCVPWRRLLLPGRPSRKGLLLPYPSSKTPRIAPWPWSPGTRRWGTLSAGLGLTPTVIPGGGEAPKTFETESGERGAPRRETGAPPRDAGARDAQGRRHGLCLVCTLPEPRRVRGLGHVRTGNRTGAGTAPSLASGQSWPHAACPRSPAR